MTRLVIFTQALTRLVRSLIRFITGLGLIVPWSGLLGTKEGVFALKRVSKLNSGQRSILLAESARLVAFGFTRISETTRRRNTAFALEV